MEAGRVEEVTGMAEDSGAAGNWVVERVAAVRVVAKEAAARAAAARAAATEAAAQAVATD